MKVIKLILCCTAVLFISGCYDKDEPNDIAYVTAIGIDKNEKDEDNYNITVQFANPTNISGGSSEEGGSGKDIMNNITVEAPNIYSAVGLIDHVISKNLNLSHMKLFVFSKEIAEEGIKDFLETISRSEEIRPNVYTAVSMKKAGEYLRETEPLVEINPAKYYQLIFEKGDFSAVPQSYNQTLYFYTNIPEKNSVIPLTGIAETDSENQSSSQNSTGDSNGNEQSSNKNESSGESSQEQNQNQSQAPINKSPYEYNLKDYKAGEVGIYQNKKGEAIGCAVFKMDKMIGELGFIETQLYNMLTNTFTQNYITIKSEKSDTPITLLVSLDNRTKIKYDKREHKSTIKLTLSGDFISLPDDYLAEHDMKEFEKAAASAITDKISDFIKMTQEDFNSDIIGFGMYAKSNFLTLKDFTDYDWENKFKDMKYEIETDFKVRRTGLTSRTEMK